MPPRSTQNSHTAAAVAEDPQQSVRSHSRTPVPKDPPVINNPDPKANQEETADEDLTENPFSDHTTPNLAQAIMLMTNELRRRDGTSRKAKSKEPDTFDSSDPQKLNNFILLCNLYFQNNPAYSEDETKVTFALSYL